MKVNIFIKNKKYWITLCILCITTIILCIFFYTTNIQKNQIKRKTVDANYLSTQIIKNKSDNYYITQASRYFDSLDTTKDSALPKYSEKCIRYEWHPWLKVTGISANQIHFSDQLIRFAGSCICTNRHFRVFNENPFLRAEVTFIYGLNPNKEYDIYEEFTFNEKGEIIFIEAWTPNSTEDDYNNMRLSTQIPSLGSIIGFDINNAAFIESAKKNPILDDFRKRRQNFIYSILELGWSWVYYN